MSLPYDSKLIAKARGLRKNLTRQERHLWYDFLRAYPIRFQRQKTIGHCIVDFYCASAKLVVELDGSQHYSEQGISHDAERTALLNQYDLEIVRYSNEDVDRQFDAVCSDIDRIVKSRISASLLERGSPHGRREP